MGGKDLANRVEGFVLAGGRSSRFGTDKALALAGGVPLLSRALGELAALGIRARIVAPDPVPYAALGAEVVSSERPGLGPGEALRALLRVCAAPWALVLATDMPGVDAGVIRALAAGLPREEPPEGPAAVCFGEASGRRHPLPGLYHRSLGGLLETLPGDVSLRGVLEEASPRILPADPEDLAPRLANLNTPLDMERFERLRPRLAAFPGPGGPESD